MASSRRRLSMTSDLSIILFGQTGHGKSSVINLIAGSEIAAASSGAKGCTLSFTPYNFPANGRRYHIWDTVGLDEPDMEFTAIGQACELIQDLTSEGGVDLLLFCIRAPRITGTSQANFRLFYEVLCRSQVPVAFVITHLEQEKEVRMDSWWDRNVEKFEKYGLKAAGHACVTGLPEHHRYQESQRNITKLLEGRNSDGRFHMPADAWTVEFSRLFGLFSLLKRESKRDSEGIMQVLMKRCGMKRRMAEEIADKMLVYGL